MREKKLATLRTILASLFVMSFVFMTNTVAVDAAPAKVTGVKQTDAASSSVDIAWDAMSGCWYEVAYSADQVTWETTTTSTNNDYISALNPGTTYFVKVRAVVNPYSSSRQEGVYSDMIQVVTSPKVTSEIAVQTDATTQSATIAWNPVPGATAYDVTCTISGEEYLVGTATTTAATITGLAADSYLSVSVYPKRTSAAGFSAVGYSMNCYGVKTTAGKLKAVVYDRDPRAKVGGKKNSNKNTLEVVHGFAYNADGYEVYLYNSKGKLKKTIEDTGLWSARFKNVKTTDTVYVSVRAYTMINGVKKYGEMSDKILSVGAPVAKAKKSGSGVKISWGKIAGAKKYNVYMSTDNKKYKKVKTVSKSKNNVQINNFKGKSFKKYQTYYYYVEAVGKYGKKKNAKSDIFYVSSFYFYTKY